eukprot:TRINITY_DN6200_c0_g1_i1.p1 TRINITY_DN6200_c0_g1~~TRINITY_DN6200_c0_g1_i1.p1  ORF type:complete len:798 (-),score=180.44 TRINITY_DN6200_c0_g1_i1:52-2406(-)
MDDEIESFEREEQESVYDGWNLYFPEHEYHEDLPFLPLLRLFLDYFISIQNRFCEEDFLLNVAKTSVIAFDYSEFKNEIELLNNEKNEEIHPSLRFEENLQEHPETTVACLGIAVFQVLRSFQSASGDYIIRKKVNFRFLKYTPVSSMKSLKANLIGKLVCIQGTVIRVSNIKPLVRELSFTCSKCGAETVQHFKDGKFAPPTHCTTKNCRAKIFVPNRTASSTIDWQKIRLQESHADYIDAGRVPRTVEVELTEDLVDFCVPGDFVSVCGVVKVVNTDVPPGKNFQSQQNKGVFLIYIDALSVVNDKQKEKGGIQKMFDSNDLDLVKEIVKQKNLFSTIVHSICPSIYGHSFVKAGLALGLFGGVPKLRGVGENASGSSSGSKKSNKMPIRSDIHILVVGDPGMGKSQMLTAVSNISPRGVYVCGSYSSTSGLTVSLMKEGGSGDFFLEAGALILADQGCCCIDEFDKMGDQYQSLLEAMEQQSISIAKAGILCNLPARTSIFAAANPVGGHYNKAKTVAENLKMNTAILSRFDLIFILLDKPDQERDKMLSEHVMAIHSSNPNKKLKRESSTRAPPLSQLPYSQLDESKSGSLLKESLRLDKNFEPIPVPLLRKYVAYVREYVKPKLTAGAKKVIQDFYLHLREKFKSADFTPITTRQLESLIRLSEARAKIECREEVTDRDAMEVVELMKESLFDALEDNHGNLDFRRTTGMSKSKQSNAFLNHLNKVSDREAQNVFTQQELYKISQDIGLKIDNFDVFIQGLNTQGFLIKKGPKSYGLVK